MVEMWLVALLIGVVVFAIGSRVLDKRMKSYIERNKPYDWDRTVKEED